MGDTRNSHTSLRTPCRLRRTFRRSRSLSTQDNKPRSFSRLPSVWLLTAAHGSPTRRASLTFSSATAGNSPRAGWRITTSTPATTWGARTSRPSSPSPGSKATTRRQPARPPSSSQK